MKGGNGEWLVDRVTRYCFPPAIIQFGYHAEQIDA